LWKHFSLFRGCLLSCVSDRLDHSLNPVESSCELLCTYLIMMSFLYPFKVVLHLFLKDHKHCSSFDSRECNGKPQSFRHRVCIPDLSCCFFFLL
jgi:hypothetical protein